MNDVEDLKAQLEALKQENERLKSRDSANPTLKVSAKGGVSCSTRPMTSGSSSTRTRPS
jgi:hypothetical protein